MPDEIFERQEKNKPLQPAPNNSPAPNNIMEAFQKQTEKWYFSTLFFSHEPSEKETDK